MNLPIRVRMTIWYTALLAIIVAAIGVFLVVRLRADLTRTVDRTLRPATDQIAAGYHAEGPSSATPPGPSSPASAPPRRP
jgi:hypothetical protein